MARTSRTYARDQRGRFASKPGGSSFRKPIGGLPKRQTRKAGSPPPQRRGLVTQRAAVRRSSTNLKGKDPADRSYSGTLSRRAQKGAVTRASNRLQAAQKSGRRRLQPGAAQGVIRPGKPVATPAPAKKPAVRGRSRLRMYATGKDGAVLKKVFDAIRNNPFGKKDQTKPRNTQVAAEWLIKRGFHNVSASSFKNSNIKGVAGYSQRRDWIYINPRKQFWKNPARAMAKDRASGHSSSASPVHVLHHEVGHSKDKRGIPVLSDQWYGEMRGVKLPGNVARKVSRYASSSPAEFVAETYAGLRAGQRYDRQVMKLYRGLMGSGDPALKARRSRRPRRRR